MNIVYTKNPIKLNPSSLIKHFSLEKEDIFHSVNYKTVIQYQQNKKTLIKIAESNKDYSITYFHGADKKQFLIYGKYKIVSPEFFQKQVEKEYHNALCHSEEKSSDHFITQHFYRKIYVKHKFCQFLKINKKQFGKQ